MIRLLFSCAVLLCTLPCFAARTVVDEVGRRVALPDHPRRVICLAPSVTDTVFALGAADLVVGVTDYTKYPAEAARKPSVGSPMTPSLETVVALKPDLVIGFQSGAPVEGAVEIEHLGIPVFLVNPHGLRGLLHAVGSVGLALNRQSAATALTASLEGRIDAVRRRTAGLRRPTVFLPIWYQPIMTAGRNAFITELIEAAGGRSVTADLPQEWPEMSLEALVERRPEALLLVRGGRVTLASLRQLPGWKQIPAVRTGTVFYVDGRIDLASPAAIDALEELARQMHPGVV